jgi:transposase
MRKGKNGGYRREDKLAAVRRLEAGEAARTLSRQLGVPRKRLYLWWSAYRARGPEGLRAMGRPPKPLAGAAPVAPADPLARAEQRVAELERKLGQQQLELDFFKQALRQVETLSPPEAGRGATASTPSSKR